MSSDKYFTKELEHHFITEDVTDPLDFGEGKQNVYALSKNTEIISYVGGDLLMSANSYGKGRCVYIAGLPYSIQNSRILMRSLYYAANKENDLKKWYADNINCEVSAYLESKKYAIINNSNEEQETTVYDGCGNIQKIILKPCEIKWLDII